MNQDDVNKVQTDEQQVQTTLQGEGEAEASATAKQSTASGLDENIAGLLCYALHFITGIIFLIIEKENRFIRFHAFQSIFVFGSIFVLYIVLGQIPLIGWLLVPFLSLAALALWVFLMYKAYQKEYYKLPFFGDLAEKQLTKS